MSKVFYDEIHRRAKIKCEEQGFVLVAKDRASWLKWVEIYYQSLIDLRDYFDSVGLLNSRRALDQMLSNDKKTMAPDEKAIVSRLDAEELNLAII